MGNHLLNGAVKGDSCGTWKEKMQDAQGTLGMYEDQVRQKLWENVFDMHIHMSPAAN